jgi:nicotinate-nucleotide adenylyltransferase
MRGIDIHARVERMVRGAIGGPRFEHCRSVARLAHRLCARFGVEPEKGSIAGLAHDAAREKAPDEILRLCALDGLPISSEERANTVLIHGRASAAMLSSLTGYDDPEVLQAIRDHVTGRPAMGALSGILFVSDFLEPTRGFLEEGLREGILSLPLDAMVLAVLGRKIQYVREMGGTTVPASEILFQELTGHVR